MCNEKYEPSIVEHMQTVQTQIRSRRTRRLIWFSTDAYQKLSQYV